MLIAEDLLLIAQPGATPPGATPPSAGRAPVPGYVITRAVAGALLGDLTLAGRVSLVSGTVEVVDATTFDDPTLDEPLARIGVRRGHPAAWWVERLESGATTDRLLEHLADQGILREGVRRRFGLPMRRRFPNADPTAELAAWATIRAGVDAPDEASARTVALILLADACGVVRAPDGMRSHPAGWPAAGVREAIAAWKRSRRLIDATG